VSTTSSYRIGQRELAARAALPTALFTYSCVEE
jgi:hypothetical protein